MACLWFVRVIISQVADAKLADWDVKFYLHPTGHDKFTSCAICAPYLMKMVPDPDPDSRSKASPALLMCDVENSTLTLPVASPGDFRCASLRRLRTTSECCGSCEL